MIVYSVDSVNQMFIMSVKLLHFLRFKSGPSTAEGSGPLYEPGLYEWQAFILRNSLGFDL